MHDGMLPFCETLLYAILSHMLCTVWPTVVDAAATRIARVLTKRAGGTNHAVADGGNVAGRRHGLGCGIGTGSSAIDSPMRCMVTDLGQPMQVATV